MNSIKLILLNILSFLSLVNMAQSAKPAQKLRRADSFFVQKLPQFQQTGSQPGQPCVHHAPNANRHPGQVNRRHPGKSFAPGGFLTQIALALWQKNSN